MDPTDPRSQGVDPATVTRGMLTASIAAPPPEQLGWDVTPAGQAKRLDDLAMFEKLIAISKLAADDAPE